MNNLCPFVSLIVSNFFVVPNRTGRLFVGLFITCVIALMHVSWARRTKLIQFNNILTLIESKMEPITLKTVPIMANMMCISSPYCDCLKKLSYRFLTFFA